LWLEAEKDIAMGISHTLWIFDLTSSSYLTSGSNQTLNGTLNVLNGLFLQPCMTDPNIAVDTAIAVFAGGTSISPGANDSVVFLVPDVGQSEIVKASGDNSAAVSNATMLGLTSTPMVNGGVAEVYWGRCYNDYEVAGSIFHESAHLKSNNDPTMHTFSSGGGWGGTGVRVLSDHGASLAQKGPNNDDLVFYVAHIPTTIPLRISAP
jgi:hypothetical protein